jgi:hypothetical protein
MFFVLIFCICNKKKGASKHWRPLSFRRENPLDHGHDDQKLAVMVMP